MAATGAYRIGSSDFFTPADLKADADTLQSQIDALDAQTNGRPGLPIEVVDAWVLFQGDWSAFYTANFGGFLVNLFTALNDSNRDQLVQFEERFADLVSRFRAAGLEVAGVDVGPKKDGGLFGGGIALDIAIVVGIVIVLIVVVARVVG